MPIRYATGLRNNELRLDFLEQRTAENVFKTVMPLSEVAAVGFTDGMSNGELAEKLPDAGSIAESR